MEGMKLRSVLIVCMVMHLLIANSEASSLGCYTLCASECAFEYNGHGLKLALCLFGCVAKCHQSADGIIDNNYFCKIGCAASSCTNQPNLVDEEKFESCVDSCSGICVKN